MNPDDFDETLTETSDNVTWINDASDVFTINFDVSASTYSDISYGISPEASNPEIYTSHEQRERHEKYPALQKAWEEYLNMYNLTHGEPPIVD